MNDENVTVFQYSPTQPHYYILLSHLSVGGGFVKVGRDRLSDLQSQNSHKITEDGHQTTHGLCFIS